MGQAKHDGIYLFDSLDRIYEEGDGPEFIEVKDTDVFVRYTTYKAALLEPVGEQRDFLAKLYYEKYKKKYSYITPEHTHYCVWVPKRAIRGVVRQSKSLTSLSIYNWFKMSGVVVYYKGSRINLE